MRLLAFRYSLVAASPQLGAIVAPMLWGMAYTWSHRLETQFLRSCNSPPFDTFEPSTEPEYHVHEFLMLDPPLALWQKQMEQH